MYLIPDGDVTIRSFTSITPKCYSVVKPSTDEWPLCNDCFPEPRPSPIDIITSLTTNVKLPKLQFFSNFSQNVDYVIKNTGQLGTYIKFSQYINIDTYVYKKHTYKTVICMFEHS